MVSYIKKIAIIVFIFALFGCSSVTEKIIVDSAKKNEAMIILGGELGSKEDIINLTQYFSDRCDYQVFTIHFKSKSGFKKCQKKLKQGFENIDLKQFDKVHFFCFILGGMVLRNYLKEEEIPNMGRTVLIRGPLEENVSNVAVFLYPNFLIRMFYGGIVIDLSNVKYTDFGKGNIEYGVIIETVPNPLAKKYAGKLKKRYKDDPIEYTTIHFAPDSPMTGYSDYTYIALNHNEMYIHPEQYIDIVLTFIDHGSFGSNADRSQENYTLDFYPVFK